MTKDRAVTPEHVSDVHSWRIIRPLSNALERLGHPTRFGDGPSLWTSAEGAKLASSIMMIRQFVPQTDFDTVAAFVRSESVAAFEAAWKMDAGPDALRDLVLAMLNPQQESPP